MPLNKKGKKILKAMEKEYGKKKGKSVFYASRNKGKIKGVEKSFNVPVRKGNKVVGYATKGGAKSVQKILNKKK